MDIRQRVELLLTRMSPTPLYPTQGAVCFIDLAQRTTQRGYLPLEAVQHFLGGRGGNMYLLYNLLDESKAPLDPEVPLIFGAGTLTGSLIGATRGNVTSRSPESRAILDTNAGDYFPSFMKKHGYDHLVIYGRHAQWTMIRIEREEVRFLDAAEYVGMNNLEVTKALQRDFSGKEGKDMAMARISSAGENRVLCSGIMAGEKSIWARGGAGAKMGAHHLKAILIQGSHEDQPLPPEFRQKNREIGKKILSASVVQNALKKVGTPFLYKPSRILGAMGTKNNQETTWHESLDADNFDPYRPGMSGCYKCPVCCRAHNDMLPDGKGGWGASALEGVTGNVSYDPSQSTTAHVKQRSYNGIKGDGQFDQYDKGEGPEYITVGKFGPNLGIREPEQVLRLNNIINDLALDASSTGSAIAWAMELYQRGIIDQQTTGGLELTWGNYPVIEQLLFLTAQREGFGDTIADSTRAVELGKYPPEALPYCMAVKGLFQSDPHDARILKAFALGLAVATRGMDHLRNRVTLEINARINDDAAFKTALYGGEVSPQPTSYAGKEYAVRRCENTFASGDAVGMCRFSTKLFNSPSTPDLQDFAIQLNALTGLPVNAERLDDIGRDITGLERLINYRLGLRATDDTLPQRWFDEPIAVGPFKGEVIDRAQFEALKQRFYRLTGLNADGTPATDWHDRLASIVTGYRFKVKFPGPLEGVPEGALIIDERVENLSELRSLLMRRVPGATAILGDPNLNLVLNGKMVMAGEPQLTIPDGSEVYLVSFVSGG